MAARPDLGMKLECSSCGERFFDLNRTPITCPKCAYVYPTEEDKSAPVVEEKPAEKPKEEEDKNEDDPEFVSLEEADAATISELTGGDDDDSTNPDEDSFLEEEGTSTSVDDIAVPAGNVDENDS